MEGFARAPGSKQLSVPTVGGQGRRIRQPPVGPPLMQWAAETFAPTAVREGAAGLFRH